MIISALRSAVEKAISDRWVLSLLAGQSEITRRELTFGPVAKDVLGLGFLVMSYKAAAMRSIPRYSCVQAEFEVN
jgi:hypothetical protein